MLKVGKRKCPVCGEKFKPTYSTLQACCSPKCAVEFNKKKQIDKRVKEMKKAKGLPELKELARAVFQTWVRKRDERLGCISCPKTVAKWDGGHYLKAQLFTGLIFEPMNCNKQCSYCNDQLEGNLIEYRKGLIKKYGEAAVESLEARANSSRFHKYSAEDYRNIIAEYRTKTKELTNGV